MGNLFSVCDGILDVKCEFFVIIFCLCLCCCLCCCLAIGAVIYCKLYENRIKKYHYLSSAMEASAMAKNN